MSVWRCAVLGFLSWLFGLGAVAQVPHPPIEAYGELPRVRNMTLSPDGSQVAFLTRSEGGDLVTLFDVASRKLSHRVRLDEISTRNIWFADNQHLIILASDTMQSISVRGKYEFSAAISLNLDNNELVWLLMKTRGLYPFQTGLGRVVGHSQKDVVYMPAYMGEQGTDPTYDLMRVDLDNGRGRRHKRGTDDTVDWLVDTDGVVMAREDYNNRTNLYEIQTYVSGRRETIYETESERIPFSLVGVKADRSALILVDADTEEGLYDDMFEMDFEGNVTAANLGRPGKDIEHIFSDPNRFVSGVEYSGESPSYFFFDPEVDADVTAMVNKWPGSSVHVQSWSDDWSRILYLVDRPGSTGQYIIQDRATGELIGIADQRPSIPSEAIADVYVIEYPARDGLTIPAILTWPSGSTEAARRNLPLIVMPHGGPASHDTVTFDWMAQYFANRGYLVLQPNFRGSTGYGNEFLYAGYGEWGRKMQDDITDGVRALVKDGFADPDRVCIVGASYGGYAALAGGAYTPDLYNCVVAIAPVTDLPRMIHDVERERGRDHWAVNYWEELIGDPRAERDKLLEISPVAAAANFTAPVLLIHGIDDTIVPVNQSKRMERALKSEGKPVDFVRLKSEDHWLSDGDTRITTLHAASEFVDAHIGRAE